MLLWEALAIPVTRIREVVSGDQPVRSRRLPYDMRCAAVTRTGQRCRGRILDGREWCLCHDPEMIQKRKAALASKPRRLRRKLSMLPDGYLRKLTSRRAVGQAMDRLYRELRLGLVTPAMADVLFRVLCRLLDSGLCDKDGVQAKLTGRTRSETVRPKLRDLLTRSEKIAWKKAVADAPEPILQFRADFDAGRVPAVSRPAKDHSAAKTGTFRVAAS